MKYPYVGRECNKIIEDYKIAGDKIIITYLDETILSVENTKTNELEIKNDMLGQAIERDYSNQYKLCKKAKRGWHMKSSLACGAVAITASGLLLEVYKTLIGEMNSDALFCASMLGGTISSLLLVTKCCEGINDCNAELEDLEKYRIYLSIREKLQNCDSQNLFDGCVRVGLGKPDINTLDMFTLEELKIFQKNLERLEKLHHLNHGTAYTYSKK